MNTITIIMLWILIVVLLFVSALYSFAEMSLASASTFRIKEFSKKGNAKEKKKAKRALKLIDTYNETITSIVIINNIINVLTSTLATTLFTETFGSGLGFTLGFLVMTILIIIFGELLPKFLAKKHPEKATMNLSGLMHFNNKILIPLTFGVKKMIKQDDTATVRTEGELMEIVQEAAEYDVTTTSESEIIKSALSFDDIQVDQIMTEASKVVVIKETDNLAQIKRKIKTTNHTRFPVVNKSKEPTGIFNAKSFLIDSLSNNKIKKEDYIFPIEKVYRLTKSDDVLEQLKVTRQKMAAITDSKGKLVGIVTIEDIAEHFLGEIYDESEKEKSGIYIINDSTFLVEESAKTKVVIEKTGAKVTGKKPTLFIDHLKTLGEVEVDKQIIGKNFVIWVKSDRHKKGKLIFEMDIV